MRILDVLQDSVVAALMLTLPIYAQTPAVDVQALRQEKAAATATFLNKTQGVQPRLAAIAKMGYPETKTFEALLEIGRDTAENSAIRKAALHRHRFDEKYFAVVTKILEDPSDGDEDLDANLVLDLGQRVTFRAPAEVRQRMQVVLRKLLDDQRARVRLQAYRVLVASHDATAINRLTESLQAKRNFPVPLPEAINLLNDDGPVSHIVAVRPYLDHADPAVKAQAARVLSVDPQSRAKIVAFVRDPRTPREVRLLALRALAREDEKFPDYAIPLVQDAQGDPQVREMAMQTLTGRMNNNKVDARSQVRFAEAVKRVSSENRGDKKLQSAASELHAYLVKTFPAVKQAQ